MKNCNHCIKILDPHWGFTTPVADPRDENPAAHGGIGYTESCHICNHSRDVLVNSGQYEYGPWAFSQSVKDYYTPSEEAVEEARWAAERAARN